MRWSNRLSLVCCALFVFFLFPVTNAQQLLPPTGLVVTPGDKLINVTWNPSSDSRVTEYEVELLPDGVVAPAFPPKELELRFPGTQFDLSNWNPVVAPTCAKCYVRVENNAATFRVNGSTAFVHGSNLLTVTSSSYPELHHNRVNTLRYKEVPNLLNRDTIFSVNTLSNTVDPTTAGTSNDHIQYGFVVYNWSPTTPVKMYPLFHYLVRRRTSTSVSNGIFVRYARQYLSGSTVYSYNPETTAFLQTASIGNNNTLHLIREHSLRRWKFAFEAHNPTSAVLASSLLMAQHSLNTDFVLTDAMMNIYPENTTYTYIGLFAETPNTLVDHLIFFDRFAQYRYDDFKTFLERMTAYSSRQSIVTSYGECALPNRIASRFSSTTRNAVFRGIYNDDVYAVRVKALGEGLESNVLEKVGISGTYQLTAGGLRPAVLLDAQAIRPGSNNMPIRRFRDYSGNKKDFVTVTTTASYLPYMSTPSNGPLGLYFPNAQSEMVEERVDNSLGFTNYDPDDPLSYFHNDLSFFALFRDTGSYSTTRTLMSKTSVYGALGAVNAGAQWDFSANIYTNTYWAGMRFHDGNGLASQAIMRTFASNNLPWANKVSMVSASFNLLSDVNWVYGLDMSEGIERNDNSDISSFPMTPTNVRPSSNPYLYTFTFGTFGAGSPSIVSTDYSKAWMNPLTQSSTTATARIGDSRIGSGYTTGYTGHIYSIALFRGLNSTSSYTQRQEVQKQMMVRYKQACPRFNLMNSTPAFCDVSELGKTCMSSCSTGSPLYGGVAECRPNGDWSTRGFACGDSCPLISSINNMGRCQRRFINEQFSASIDSNSRYTSTPFLPQLSDIFRVSNGVLSVSLALKDSCSLITPHLLHLNSPLWALQDFDPLIVSVRMRVVGSQGTGGVAVRVQSVGAEIVAYVAEFSGGGTGVILSSLQGSSKTTLAELSLPVASGAPLTSRFAFNAWHSLSLIATGPQLNVLVNGTSLGVVHGETLLLGSAGIYAESGFLQFDDFVVSGDCGLLGACKPDAGEQCVYQCAPGYSLQGAGSVNCLANGVHSSPPPECIPTPPLVRAANWTVSESAPQGFTLGTVNASSMGATDEIILHKIIQHTTPFHSNVEPVYDVDGVLVDSVGDVFSVSQCSGDVFLSKPGILDSRNYDPDRPGLRIAPYPRKLVVRSYVAGADHIYTDTTFLIQIERTLRPPIFQDELGNVASTLYRSLPENQLGPFDVPVRATAREPNPLVYDIVYGNDLELFAINASTGQLRVLKLYADYEDLLKRTFDIMVRATDSVNSQKFAMVGVQIQTLDRPDPPVSHGPQSVHIKESEAIEFTTIVPSLDVTDQDTIDELRYTIDAAAAGDAYSRLTEYISVEATSGVVTFLRNVTYDIELQGEELQYGVLVRELMVLPVRVTDSFGLSVIHELRIFITPDKDAAATPFIHAHDMVAPLNSAGGQLVKIYGTNLSTIINLDNDTAVFAWLQTSNDDPTTVGKHCNPECTSNCEALRCRRVHRLTGCRVVLTDEHIQCTSPPGWGSNLEVVVNYGRYNRTVSFDSPLPRVSYQAHTLTSVAGSLELGRLQDDPLKLPTEGGAYFILTGTNFGYRADVAMKPWIRVFYGTNFEFEADVIFTRTAGVLEYPSNTQIKIRTREGVGSNLPIRVMVGNVNATRAGLFSHTPPTFTPLVLTSPMINMNSAGGFNIEFHGTNWGPLSVPILDTKLYGTFSTVINGVSASRPISLALTCTREAATAHTRMKCIVPAGLGYPVYLYMRIGNVMYNTNIYLGYETPRISSIVGDAMDRALTQGGQQLRITGTGFGPQNIPFAPMDVNVTNLIKTAPITLTYGLMGTEYTASDCHVTVTGTEIVCTTAPGTGKNLQFRIRVLATQVIYTMNLLSYAPPSITGFEGVGLVNPNALKGSGGERVRIFGTNFGPAIVSGKFQSTYAVQLKETRTSQGQTISSGSVTFTATGCTMITPHTVVECSTAAGAGASMSWSLNVDGQLSTLPAFGYDAPTVTAVYRENGQQPMGAFALSTDGGETLILQGTNFGPRVNCGSHLPEVRNNQTILPGWLPRHRTPQGAICRGYVQKVRFGRTGLEYSVVNFNVLNHTHLELLTAPGFGQNILFSVTVGAQVSLVNTAAAARAQFRKPVVLEVRPRRNQKTVPAAGTLIEVIGRDFSLLDPQASLGVLFGNPRDNTLRGSVLPTVNRFPDWQNFYVVGPNSTDSNATNTTELVFVPGAGGNYTLGGNHTVSFVLPAGVLPLRAVRVAVFATQQPSIQEISDPLESIALAEANTFLNYSVPVVEAVSVVAADPTDTDFVRWLLNTVPSLQASGVTDYFVVRVRGQSFGQNASVLGDSVVRSVQFQPATDPEDSTVWTSSEFLVYRWSDSEIVLASLHAQARLRLQLQGARFAPDPMLETVPLIVRSNVYTYSDISPVVNGIVGSSGPFNTSGGVILAVNISNIGSARTLEMLVGGQPCPLVNAITGADITDLGNELIRNEALYSGSEDRRTWRVSCRLPPGEGIGNALHIRRDGVLTFSSIMVNYAPPRISRILVRPAGAPAREYLAAAAGNTHMLFDTEPFVIEVYGSNFGLRPLISVGSTSLQLGPGSFYPQHEHFNDHSTIRLLTLPEDGGTSALFQLSVGGQTTTSPAPGLSLQTFTAAYLPPSISAFTPQGPTEGGLMVQLQGRNLGIYEPFVLVGDSPCWNVLYNRETSPYTLSCRLPPGVGANKSVSILVGGQLSEYANMFSYQTPVIEAVEVFDGIITPSKHSWEYYDYYGYGGDDGVSDDGTQRVGYFIPSTAPSGRVFFGAGPSAGGYSVRVRGRNFGLFDESGRIYDPLYEPNPSLAVCLFMAWRGESSSLRPPVTCNGQLDSVGEGEVPGLAIQFWNDTVIEFIAPPGAGVRELIPLVGLQFPNPTDELTWVYQPPVIGLSASTAAAAGSSIDLSAIVVHNGLTPSTGPTDGGTLVTISGHNFGPALLNSNTTEGRNAALMMPQNMYDYLRLPQGPKHVVTVLFHTQACISNHLDFAGAPPAIISGCSSEMQELDHSQLRFRVPSYIGVNRTVRVLIQDHLYSHAMGRTVPIVLSSNSALFSYERPLFKYANPYLLRQSELDGPSRVAFAGENLGSQQQWLDSCSWTAEERVVNVSVGGMQAVMLEPFAACPEDAGTTRPGPAARSGDTQFDVLVPQLTVGIKNVSYRVVGQSNFNLETSGGSLYAVCAPDNFGTIGETCLQCPLGATCAGYDEYTNEHTYPVPDKGWFTLNGTMLDACPEEIRAKYPTRNLCVVPCEPADACLGNNICADGYASKAPMFRCGSCADGFFKRATRCVKCPDSPYGLIVGMILLVLAAGGAAFVLNKKKVNLAFISIGIDYFQVLAIFANSKINWPEAIQELFHVLSAFNLNIEIVAPECLVPDVSYKSKFTVIMLLPVAVGGMFFVGAVLSTIWKRVIKQQRVRLANEGAALASSMLLLFYVLYIYITRNVLDIFSCAPTEPPDGKTYMAAVFEECGVPGGTQMSLMGGAVIALLVYVIGYPIAVISLLYRNREIVIEDQLLRAKGQGNDRLSNPRAYDFRKRFSRAYYQYKPNRYLWLLAIILRKLLLSVTYVVFNRNASFQLAAAFLVLILAFSAQVRFAPYMGPFDGEAVMRTHAQRALTSPMLAQISERLLNVESRARKRAYKNVVNATGTVDTSALLAQVRRLLLDYNTVESILLFSAAIVALMGMMYNAQSEISSYYGGARDALTGVIITVVTVSIIYFVVVASVELTTICQDQARQRVRARSGKLFGSPDAAMKEKDAATRRAFATEKDVLTAGPIDSTNNPLFADSSLNLNAKTVHESLLQVAGQPSIDVWRLFQNSYRYLNGELEVLAKEYAEVSKQQQRISSAESMLVNLKRASDAPDDTDSPTFSPEASPRISAKKKDFGSDAGGSNPAMGAKRLSRSNVASPLSRAVSLRQLKKN